MLAELQGRDRAEALFELAGRANDRGDYQRAMTLLGEVEATAHAIPDPELEGWAVFRQGGCAYMAHDFAESAELYASSAQTFAEAGFSLNAARALWGQADALRAAGDWADCLEIASQAKALGEAEGDPEVLGDACFLQAKALYFLDREQDSLAACLQARDSYRAIGRADRVAQVDDFTLTVCLFLNDLDRALELARGCLVLARASHSTADDPYARLRLAETHLKRDEIPDALREAESARALYRESDRLLGVARCDRLRGEALLKSGRYQECIEAFTDARVLFDAHGLDYEALSCDTRRSAAHYIIGEHARAAAINRRLIEQYGALDDGEDDVRLSIFRLVENLFEAGRYEECARAGEEFRGAWGDATPQDFWFREFLGFKAAALEATGFPEDAAAIADRVIAATPAREASSGTALCYEIRGRARLATQEQAAAQDFAHAIALHLARGSIDRAEELSKHFLPVDALPVPKQSEAGGSP